MLYKDSSRAHPEFDLSAASEVLAVADPRPLIGGLITSPWDIFAAETLRDRHGLRTGEPFPADVFIFGKGEPIHRSCTKVGGRPFWPVDRPWPGMQHGRPYHFVAQFNFSDSMDIVPDLPADLLVVLADPDVDWLVEDDGLAFHWVPTDVEPASDLAVPCVCRSATGFFGAIHRTCDYPHAYEIVSRLDVRNGFLLPVLNGTKIGGLPHFIQSGESESLSGTFLCQLGSIQAAPNVPYPWVNHEAPFHLRPRDADSIYCDDNCAIFGDMGSIYFYVDDDGCITWLFECY